MSHQISITLRKHGQPDLKTVRATLSIRQSVTSDAIKSGKLQCHASVYDADMNAHPETSKPCVGLSQRLKAKGDNS